jgi:hypothetical protein
MNVNPNDSSGVNLGSLRSDLSITNRPSLGISDADMSIGFPDGFISPKTGLEPAGVFGAKIWVVRIECRSHIGPDHNLLRVVI